MIPVIHTPEETKTEDKTKVEDKTKTEDDTETDSEKNPQAEKKDSSSTAKIIVAIGTLAVAGGLAYFYRKEIGEFISKLRKGEANETSGNVSNSTEAVTSNTAKAGKAPTVSTSSHEEDFSAAKSLIPQGTAKIIQERNIDVQNPKNTLEKQIVQAQSGVNQVNLSTDAQGKNVLAVFNKKGKLTGLYKFDKEGNFLEYKTFYKD